MRIHVHGNIVVNKDCQHSIVYGGNNILIKGQLYGGSTYAHSNIFVGKQLGSSVGTRTSVYLGILPSSIQAFEKMERFLEILSQNIIYLKTLMEKMTFASKNLIIHLNVTLKRREMLEKKIAKWKVEFSEKTEELAQCRVICSGVVYPGVQITIGSVSHETDKLYENVIFRLKDRKIIVEPITSDVLPV